MQLNKIVLPQDIYSAHLETVNNIKFTRREVDIIAYLFSGRSAKTISFLLSITPKTIESHMRNIMIKLERNSRDGIIDFIEKSDKFIFVKEHYLSLLAQASFEKYLLKISELIRSQAPACLLIYWREKVYHPSIICCLDKHLKLAGIKLLSEAKEGQSMSDPLFDLKHRQADYALYCFTEALLNHQNEREDIKKEDFFQRMRRISENPNCTLTLFLENGQNENSFKELDSIRYINFSDEGYYSFVFKVLKKLLPNIKLDNIISEFKEQCVVIYDSFEKASAQSSFSKKTLEKRSLLSHVKSYIYLRFLKRRRTSLFVGSALFFTTLFIVFLFFSENEKGRVTQYTQEQSAAPTRSDLIVPTGAIFLDRPHLTAKIDESLKGPQDIKTVALVGIGGAGKTSLSRQYARQQKANLVWEMNAETPESLSESFENLATALSKTEEERKVLRELRDIKDPKEREKGIISFVRERLKNLSNWFLIYDNVEKFADIQKFFPHDADVWGKGKNIIITRDKNIENNDSITHTIHVGELTPKEKLSLFMNIMNNGRTTPYTSSQIEEAEKFLQDIPPFPLDVSIAAYYLKITNVPYEKYLEHLKEHNKDFTSVQENVLKETTNYTKTRYGIITVSLEHLIDTHKDFADLLLLISLVDFQNIPRDLLNTFKNDVTVENFIYNLKKYSLITHESMRSSTVPSTFSIHRSTQEISLEYLIKKLDLKKDHPLIQSIFNSLEEHIDKVTNEEDLSRMKILVNHCEVLLKEKDLLSNPMRGAIGGKLGYIYYYLNDYTKAKQKLEESLSILNTHDTENHDSIAHILMYLGDVYSELGNHERAQNLCERSLLTYKKYFSENHTGIARALAYLGNVYRRLGDYNKAKDLCEQSLAIYQNRFSENPIRVSWVLAHLGITHNELGNLEQAKQLLEQSLASYTQHLSENHARVAWVSAHLGYVHKELGNYEHAKHLLDQALKIYKQHFSENHVRVAWVTSLLGDIYKDLGDYEKAKLLLEQSLIIYEKQYGKNHTKSGLILRNLGQVYFLMGQIRMGEDLIQKSLNIFQANNSPESYIALEILADFYLKQAEEATWEKDIQKSQDLKERSIYYLRQANEIVKKHFSMNSPQVIRIQSKLNKIEK